MKILFKLMLIFTLMIQTPNQQHQLQPQNLLNQNLLPSQPNRLLHNKQLLLNKHQHNLLLLKKLLKLQNKRIRSLQLKDLNQSKNILEAEVKQEFK